MTPKIGSLCTYSFVMIVSIRPDHQIIMINGNSVRFIHPRTRADYRGPFLRRICSKMVIWALKLAIFSRFLKSAPKIKNILELMQGKVSKHINRVTMHIFDHTFLCLI